ncbi:MAG: hypothetical protein FJ386_12175 [Verrucomicrobia bacterium]|nr:hypothetical protein [Verrucomicrobiota bacterium]
MNTLELNPNQLGDDLDWEGNNIAIRCRLCDTVFIVSAYGRVNGGERACPKCGKTKGFVKGGKLSGGKASIQWSTG